jgi:hypothetical protein
MLIEKLLGGSAVAAPRGRINLHVHKAILGGSRCYDL